MGLPPALQGQEPDENAKKILEERLAPTKMIILDMPDQDIIKRIQQLPEEQILGTHLTQTRIAGLLKKYREMNNAESGQFVVEDFFKENKISCHHAKVGPQTVAILESLVK